jgi:hypothetical protein
VQSQPEAIQNSSDREELKHDNQAAYVGMLEAPYDETIDQASQRLIFKFIKQELEA